MRKKTDTMRRALITDGGKLESGEELFIWKEKCFGFLRRKYGEKAENDLKKIYRTKRSHYSVRDKAGKGIRFLELLEQEENWKHYKYVSRHRKKGNFLSFIKKSFYQLKDIVATIRGNRRTDN